MSQRELLPQQSFDLKPKKALREPRLWVRRLAIWKEPGVILRNIELRPGLNIIWSPDPAERDKADGASTALGHGSGKTLFCRLLRYCLGEDHFAPDAQRDRIAVARERGLVGAEVVLDGTVWAIVRSIGMSRRQIAIAGGDMDALAAGSEESTGIEPFVRAVERGILSTEVADLIPGDRPLRAWLVALAWLSRDQECRFDSVLDWRSKTSDSLSPARGLSTTQALVALRALVGAIEPAELALDAEIAGLDQRRTGAERESDHHEWVPALLIHDSPREADLGLSVYHRIFEFARALENFGEQPLFQYIVTTTTRPPEGLRVLPWLRLELEGEPAEKRLLMCDL